MNDKTLNPEFFTKYEFETKLPGPSLLKVQIYDSNNFRFDEVMGETVIDLEDRFYHPRWAALDIKPVEVRVRESEREEDMTTQMETSKAATNEYICVVETPHLHMLDLIITDFSTHFFLLCFPGYFLPTYLPTYAHVLYRIAR
jgi:hypothetical protein